MDTRTARYKILPGQAGNRYRFFCGASGAAVCTTAEFAGKSAEAELLLAWESEGREYFSLCPQCGRFVCDTMFNADVCQCVDCAPWEQKPLYCRKCGAPIAEINTFCTNCGGRAQYGEVWPR